MTAFPNELVARVQSFVTKYGPADSMFRADLYVLLQEVHRAAAPRRPPGYLVLETRRPWVSDEIEAAQFAFRDGSADPPSAEIRAFKVVADAIRAGYDLMAPPQPAYMPMGTGTVILSSGRFAWWLEKRSPVSP